MRPFITAMALLVATSAIAAPFDAEMSKDMPKDIAAFLDRDGQCWHWAGEEATDAARAKEIAQAMSALKCDHVPKKEALLRQKYRDDESVLKRLNTADATYR